MAERMPPPGSAHGMTVVIGMGKPSGSGRMIPPGMKEKGPDAEPPDEMPEEHAKDKDGKVSEEDALVVPEEEHCSDCKNWDPTSGACAKVAGSFEAGDACVNYFDPLSGKEDEPDADEIGGPPDMDADDQAMPAQA